MASLILVPTSPNEIEIVATRSMLQRITVLRAARASDPPALLVVPNRIVGAQRAARLPRASGRAGRGARTARPLPARARRGLRRAAVDRCRPSWLTCAPGRRNPGGAGAAQPGSGTATELAASSGHRQPEGRPSTEAAGLARYRSRPTGRSTGTASPAEGDCRRAEGGLPRRADDEAAAPERSRCGHQGLGHSPGRQPDASAAAASLREPVSTPGTGSTGCATNVRNWQLLFASRFRLSWAVVGCAGLTSKPVLPGHDRDRRSSFRAYRLCRRRVQSQGRHRQEHAVGEPRLRLRRARRARGTGRQ